MPRHIKFTDIGQFRNVIKSVTDHVRYKGKDQEGNPIFDPGATLPVITFTGTTKLHGCFKYDTKIALANGEQENISDIKKGTYVLTYDFNNESYSVAKVINLMNNNYNKKWIELIFDNGNIITCTEDHLFYTKNRGWIQANDLNNMDEFIDNMDEFINS